MPPESKYVRRAIAAGLDPATASVHDVCCAEMGLVGEESSFVDLAGAKLGREPGQTSLATAEHHFGKNLERLHK